MEEIGYVVETVTISGRTTAVVHAVVNCYAPTVIKTYDTPSYILLMQKICLLFLDNLSGNLSAIGKLCLLDNHTLGLSADAMTR